MGAFTLLALLLLAATANAGTVDGLLQQYRSEGAGELSANRGAALWRREVTPAQGSGPRQCGSCHGSNLRQAGKHARTGKRIEPLAPSVNPARLKDAQKIEKWFRRNCKWTWGRECTAQEKGDLVLFLSNQ